MHSIAERQSTFEQDDPTRRDVRDPSPAHALQAMVGNANLVAMLDAMEPVFGEAFGDVRIHTGEDAADAAEAQDAHAFTEGRDIVLSEAATDGDARLLAHELAHVVQQTRATGQFAGAPELEAEADTAANAVANGEHPVIASRAVPGTVQRQRHDATQPTARQIRRADQLTSMAQFPAQALPHWSRLAEAERTIVVFSMMMRYGEEFARAFLAIASDRRARRRETVVHFTNIIDQTHEQLQRRGFRLAGVGFGIEYWVLPNGDELRRIMPSEPSSQNTPPANQPAQQPPPPPQPPTADPLEPPAVLPSRSTFGPPMRTRDGAEIMGSHGRAVQYQDGTIELAAGGETTTYRPHPASEGSYDVYGADGRLIENVVIVIELPDVFGATP